MDNETEKSFVYKRTNSLLELLDNMRRRKELYDVTVQVGEQNFTAHKVILAAVMDYFREMLKTEGVDQKVIWVVPGVKPDCGGALIALDGFLYCFDYEIGSGARYCLKSRQWRTISGWNIGCRPVSSGYVVDYILVVCHGHICSIETSKPNRIHRYSPEIDKWEVVYGGKKRGCEKFEAAVLNEKIYICGGKTNDASTTDILECFDPETKKWLRLANMNQARSSHLLVALNGKMWAVGGASENNRSLLNFGSSWSSAEVYDPVSNIWTMVSPMKEIKGQVFGGVLSYLPGNPTRHIKL